MGHLWVIVALVSAFSLASSDAFTKKALSLHNEYLIAWLRLIFSLPLLFLSFLFVPIPALDGTFWRAFIVALPLEIAALILYTKALKLSPLSLTLPFLSLTPVFLIVVPYILLGESVSLTGAMGILLIAAGGYSLHLKEFRKGIFEPLAAIAREKGSLCMIGVAVIYSFTSSLVKVAIEHSSPLFFGAVYFAALVLLFTPLVLIKCGGEARAVFRNGAIRAAIMPGLFYSVMIVTTMIGLSMAKVAYMISVKRLSLVIGVLYGRILFKEAGFRERLAGTALMMAGFILIVFSR